MVWLDMVKNAYIAQWGENKTRNDTKQISECLDSLRVTDKNQTLCHAQDFCVFRFIKYALVSSATCSKHDPFRESQKLHFFNLFNFLKLRT
jgi:hypothetical protein